MDAAELAAEMVHDQMIALHREWLVKAGAEVSESVPVEISPKLALDAAELAAKLRPGVRITSRTFLGPGWQS